MNKPLAIGLIILFILSIAGSAIWLTVRPSEETQATEEVGILRRFPLNLFGLGGEEEPQAGTAPADGQEPSEKLTLSMISPGPITGFAPVKNGIRFLEKETGHVSESGPQGENAGIVSNTTIPRTFETIWSPDALKSIMRYSEGETARIISAEFVASSTKATPIPANAISAVYSPDSKRIAYLIPSGDGARTIAADPDNSKQTEINVLPFGEFQLAWPEKNSIYYQTRPSGLTLGFLFKYNIQSGSLDKILGDLNGLETRFSADAAKIVYSVAEQNNEAPRLFVYDVKTRESSNLQAKGLARKCVFSRTQEDIIYCALDQNPPAAIYPDEWLQGAAGTRDLPWELNFKTGSKKNLDAERTFDVSQIDVSPDDGFLYFLNRADESLWSLKIK